MARASCQGIVGRQGPLDAPVEVDRGGPGGDQLAGRSLGALAPMGGQRHPHGPGYTEGGRAPDGQRPDGVAQLLHARRLDERQFAR